jgi:hypothetical protein
MIVFTGEGIVDDGTKDSVVSVGPMDMCVRKGFIF